MKLPLDTLKRQDKMMMNELTVLAKSVSDLFGVEGSASGYFLKIGIDYIFFF